MILAIFVLLAYLLGSISFAMVASRVFRLPDPRTYGSMNPGATNVLRSGKKMAAALTLLGDMSKGWLAVALAAACAPGWGLDETAVFAVALAVFWGHIFPVFLGFKGGKGVATAAGVFFGLHIWVGALTLASWIATVLVSRISSLSALVGAVLAPVYAVIFTGFGLRSLAVLIISLIVIWRHQSNIINLLAGKETKVGSDSSS